MYTGKYLAPGAYLNNFDCGAQWLRVALATVDTRLRSSFNFT
jgi:hypothetical protein